MTFRTWKQLAEDAEIAALQREWFKGFWVGVVTVMIFWVTALWVVN